MGDDKTSNTLVIVSPESAHLADLLRQQFKAPQRVQVLVDRRRSEPSIAIEGLLAGEPETRDRRRRDITMELRATGWAVVRDTSGPPPDPGRPWHLPWLQTQLIVRMILGTRWSIALWPTAQATLRDALRARGRILREGWFN